MNNDLPPVRRSTDNITYMRSLEKVLADTESERQALELAHAHLSRENANLRHQLFAQTQELTQLRRVRADVLASAIERGLHQEPT